MIISKILLPIPVDKDPYLHILCSYKSRLDMSGCGHYERMIIMATKSILKSVNIKNKGAALSLARAMENAHSKKSIPVKMSRPVSEATEDEIMQMFGDKNR